MAYLADKIVEKGIGWKKGGENAAPTVRAGVYDASDNAGFF